MCVPSSSCSPSASPVQHRQPWDPFSTRPHVLHQAPIWSGPAAHFSFHCVTCFHPAPNPSLSIHNLSCLWMSLCSPCFYPPLDRAIHQQNPAEHLSIGAFPPAARAPLSQPGQGHTFHCSGVTLGGHCLPPCHQQRVGYDGAMLQVAGTPGSSSWLVGLDWPQHQGSARGTPCFGAPPSGEGAG